MCIRDRRKPEEFFKFYRDKMLCDTARPNAAHLKLAEMEKKGKLQAVITQNIDNLHQMAGSKNVLELHGSVYRNYCTKCGKSYEDVYKRQCLKWSKQRATRGFADCDVWNMYGYLEELMPAMLQYLKDNRMGSPAMLGENYTDKNGFMQNDTCHKEWDKILDRMIFLWGELDEEKCTKKNPYDEAYTKAMNEFTDKYGFFGEKLETEEEDVYKRQGRCSTVIKSVFLQEKGKGSFVNHARTFENACRIKIFACTFT